MTDFRDPNYRDPTYRDPMRRDPALRDSEMSADSQAWSNATWGWIAGIAVVVLVLAVMFSGGDSTRTADQPANPPSTVGQRTTPPAPPAAPNSEAPTMNRPAPAPAPAPAPTPPAQP